MFHTPLVKSPSEFTIGDISGGDHQPHTHGGIVQQVKVPKCVHFVSEMCRDQEGERGGQGRGEDRGEGRGGEERGEREGRRGERKVE